MTQTVRTIPFNVLAPGIQAIRGELDAAIGRVLDSGWVLLGPELQRFEAAFAAFHGPELQCVGVSSGTDALRIGLLALSIQPGDEVLVVANAGVPPVAALVATGARPVYCDVDPSTHTLDPDEIAQKRTPRTRAILVVHLYGQVAAMDRILEIARAHGLKVLEDCAQAHAAGYQGRLAGTWGDAAAFSFYPTKNLGALGDAGAVLTRDAAVADRARLLRQYGWRQRYVSELHSTVSRMDDLQAAVLLAKLPHLSDWNRRRQQLAAHYRQRLQGLVELPPEGGVFHLFVIRTRRRDELKTYLREHGVSTDIHYPLPVHQQTPYAQPVQLPATEQLAQQILSLPMYPDLADEDVDYICDQIAAFFGDRGA